MMRIVMILLLALTFGISSEEKEALEHLKQALEKQYATEGFFYAYVINRHTKGEKLLSVRGRKTPLQRIVYKPTGSYHPEIKPKPYEYHIEPYRRNDTREVFIGFDAKRQEYRFYYENGVIAHNQSRTPEPFSIAKEALGVIVRYFRVLAVDTPMLGVGIKYLQNEAKRLGLNASLRIQTSYRDREGDEVRMDEEGGVYTTLALRPLQTSPLRIEHYLEQQVIKEGVSYHYHYMPNPYGMVRYWIDYTKRGANGAPLRVEERFIDEGVMVAGAGFYPKKPEQSIPNF